MRDVFGSLRTLVLMFFLTQGCGPDSTLIIVEIEGRSAPVNSLRFRAELNGKQATPPDVASEGIDDFGLLLPAHASGQFLLAADGLDTSGCIAAQGKTDTVLMGQARVRMRLEMASLVSPVCKPSQ